MKNDNKLILMILKFDTKRKEREKNNKNSKHSSTLLLCAARIIFPTALVIGSINFLVTDGLMMVTVMELMVK